ncbi:TlpA family protein disulfide reductase [Mucilaginibacter lutimaris]|uniref:TlpA family protein disulfide reductase n=1 Tax=Mucilaginibacter lutimaris TaxID=931629 RepID=A0ABW2ZEB1_9SPHI
MKLKICSVALLCLFFKVAAHAQTEPVYLKVGDKMPDVEIKKIMNWNRKTARISDFRGKMIVLDMWNSFCGSCIAGFPKLDSLQRRYKDKLQVLLVNPSSDNETVRSMKIVIDRMNSWSDKPFKLPIVFRDSIISRNFDFYGVPFSVWIGPDGTIVAIPKLGESIEANIDKVLAGEKINVTPRIINRPANAKRRAYQ